MLLCVLFNDSGSFWVRNSKCKSYHVSVYLTMLVFFVSLLSCWHTIKLVLLLDMFGVKLSLWYERCLGGGCSLPPFLALYPCLQCLLISFPHISSSRSELWLLIYDDKRQNKDVLFTASSEWWEWWVSHHSPHFCISCLCHFEAKTACLTADSF